MHNSYYNNSMGYSIRILHKMGYNILHQNLNLNQYQNHIHKENRHFHSSHNCNHQSMTTGQGFVPAFLHNCRLGYYNNPNYYFGRMTDLLRMYPGNNKHHQ